jgi:hypothetical protein
VSDRESLPGHRRINYGAISVVISLVAMGAVVTAQWGVMTEQRRMSEARDLEQNAEIAELEQRLRSLENNRAIEQRLAELQASLGERLAKVETSIGDLRRDVRGRRGSQ